MSKKEKEEVVSLLENLSALELVDRLIAEARIAGFRLAQLTSTKSKEAQGAYGSAVRTMEKTSNEVKRRLGVHQSPEVTNREAFIYLATVRSKSKCGWCGVRPLKGRGLDFWTTEFKNPLPLMRMMAWGGASSTVLKERIDSCCVLCASCAKHRGADLLSNGLVNLKAYDVEML